MFLQPRFGGIETYVRELVRELRALRPDLRITMFARPAARSEGWDWGEGVRTVTSPLVGRRYTSALSEALLLARLARREGVDVLHSVAMTGPLRTTMPHVVTVHDLIWMDVPDSPDPMTVRVWRALVPRVARAADRVIAVSHATGDDVVRRLRVPSERVDVVHQGFGQPPRAAPVEVRARFGLGDGPLLLAVSALKSHKNLLRLVRAFALVRRRAPEVALVIPGNPSPYQETLHEEAERLGVAASVHFPGFVDDAELEGLYAAATVSVFPSLHEGFGFPLLEAMARSVPVACSDVSALPEVAGDAARYFDPHDERDIADALLGLLSDAGERERLIELGSARAATFTWRKTAEGTLASYERALAARGRA